ncbi:unnamed protein product, partial [Didymodactylos carnosus]
VQFGVHIAGIKRTEDLKTTKIARSINVALFRDIINHIVGTGRQNEYITPKEANITRSTVSPVYRWTVGLTSPRPVKKPTKSSTTTKPTAIDRISSVSPRYRFKEPSFPKLTSTDSGDILKKKRFTVKIFFNRHLYRGRKPQQQTKYP